MPRLIVWMSFRLTIPGGVLSSMARFRFTSQRYAATKTKCRSTGKQRMANRGLTSCLNPGVQSIVSRVSPNRTNSVREV